MILHTIINEYDVLQAQDAISEPVYKETQYGFLEYRQGMIGKQLIRIHTTDLSKYLTKDINI